jgi:hypothetical protein
LYTVFYSDDCYGEQITIYNIQCSNWEKLSRVAQSNGLKTAFQVYNYLTQTRGKLGGGTQKKKLNSRGAPPLCTLPFNSSTVYRLIYYDTHHNNMNYMTVRVKAKGHYIHIVTHRYIWILVYHIHFIILCQIYQVERNII